MGTYKSACAWMCRQVVVAIIICWLVVVAIIIVWHVVVAVIICRHAVVAIIIETDCAMLFVINKRQKTEFYEIQKHISFGNKISIHTFLQTSNQI